MICLNNGRQAVTLLKFYKTSLVLVHISVSFVKLLKMFLVYIDFLLFSIIDVSRILKDPTIFRLRRTNIKPLLTEEGMVTTGVV